MKAAYWIWSLKESTTRELSSHFQGRYFSTNEFEICPNCKLHGHYVIDGKELREALSQEGALRQLYAELAKGSVTEVEAIQMRGKILASRMPKTERQAVFVFGRESDIEEIVDPLVIRDIALALAGNPPPITIPHIGARSSEAAWVAGAIG